jgi:hypothetical protein
MKVKAIIPLDDFRTILTAVRDDDKCKRAGCGTNVINCRITKCLEALREWWTKTNGESAPGFVHYETIIHNTTFAWAQRTYTPEDRFRRCFARDSSMSHKDAYCLLEDLLRQAFTEYQQRRATARTKKG